ncbi:MAG: YhgE/Pip family protein [Mycoplasma sp.]|nr:YhgE/Pip family protein [Mycoplasma sp.]
MFKVFWHEIKNILSSKWKILGFILILLIPLLYAGVMVGAFWKPITNIGQIDMRIYNFDSNGPISTKIENTILNTKNLHIGTSDPYKFDVKKGDINGETLDSIEDEINDDNYYAAFVIPKTYSDDMVKYGLESFLKSEKAVQPTNPLIPIIEQLIPNVPTEPPKLDFINSYKSNYLAGEFSSLISQTNSLFLSSLNISNADWQKLIVDIFPTLSNNLVFLAQINTIVDAINQSLHLNQKGSDINNDINKIISNNRISGEHERGYGSGLAPYFMSMASWAGCLAMTFFFKNKRLLKNQGTVNTYFGKGLVWIMTAILQTLLMFLVITLIGVRWDANPLITLSYALLISISFAVIIHSLASAFRFEEVASFLIIILLIFQLTSSSGTFPVETQNGFFIFLSKFLPFTFTVQSYRELMSSPDYALVFSSLWHIFVFFAIVPIGFFANWLYDKKHKVIVDGKTEYKSYEINLHDE